MASRQRAGALSTVEIGPAVEVAAAFSEALFWQVTLPQVVGGTLLLLGGFMVLLGALNRRDRHLLYFGGMCLAWTLLSMARAPISDQATELLVSATVPLITLCAVQFLLRYAMWQHRVIDVALVVQCLVDAGQLADGRTAAAVRRRQRLVRRACGRGDWRRCGGTCA